MLEQCSQPSDGEHRLEANDGLIVESILRGHVDDFEIFVHKYQRALLSLANRQLGHPQLAEEAVQESFLGALKSLHTYNSKFAFRTWLWTILLNQCRRIGSRHQKHQMLPLATELGEYSASLAEAPTSEAEPSAAAIQRESSSQLEQLLQELPTQQARAIRLRFFDGMKYREIAETMQSSLSAAKQRVRLGLEAIAERLHHTHPAELKFKANASEPTAVAHLKPDSNCKDT